jgi:mannose-1-phosphate guanylyltransferase
MGSISTAMILAAGFGQRLKPLSLLRPKALFPVLNKSMVNHWLTRLQEAGVEKVVINAHYLADNLILALKSAINEFKDLEIIILVEKETILGTGGGIKNALKYLKGNFLVVNVDIFTDISLTELFQAHMNNPGCAATLAVVDRPLKATVSVGHNDRLLGFRSPQPLPGEVRRLCGAGLMVLNETLDLPEGFSDIIEQLAAIHLNGQSSGQNQVQVALFEDVFWSDMGTVADYWALNSRLARGMTIAEEPLEGKFSGFLVSEKGAKVAKDAFVKDCVLWSGADIGPGASVISSVVAGKVSAGEVVEGEAVIDPITEAIS